MYDERILLFPYEFDTVPYEKFKRWEAPPPNPEPMGNEEKLAASRRRAMYPPRCKCGLVARIERPPPGLTYKPFFRCPVDGQVCIFGYLMC